MADEPAGRIQGPKSKRRDRLLGGPKQSRSSARNSGLQLVSKKQLVGDSSSRLESVNFEAMDDTSEYTGGADVSTDSEEYSDSDSDSSIDFDVENIAGWESFEFVMLAVDYRTMDFRMKGLYRKQRETNLGFPVFKNRYGFICKRSPLADGYFGFYDGSETEFVRVCMQNYSIWIHDLQEHMWRQVYDNSIQFLFEFGLEVKSEFADLIESTIAKQVTKRKESCRREDDPRWAAGSMNEDELPDMLQPNFTESESYSRRARGSAVASHLDNKGVSSKMVKMSSSKFVNKASSDNLITKKESYAKFRTIKRGKTKYLANYQLKGELGKGSWGTVKLAMDVQSQQEYAIKFIPRALLEKKRPGGRFGGKKQLGGKKRLGGKKSGFALGVKQVKDEIAIMRLLDHPNLVELYDVIEAEDYLHLVLEYIPHGSIAPITQPLTKFNTVRMYMRDLFMGLNHLHSKRIAHGDIKPENILLGNDGHLRLSDFGVSRHFKQGDKSVVTGLETTPAYQAPEELKGNYRPWPADIWALGVVMYEFLTGEHPFLGKSQVDTYNNIETVDPQLPNRILLDRANFNMTNFLDGLLKKNAKERLTLKQIKEDKWLCGNDPWVDRLEVTFDAEDLEITHSMNSNQSLQSNASDQVFLTVTSEDSLNGEPHLSVQYGRGNLSPQHSPSHSPPRGEQTNTKHEDDEESEAFVDNQQVAVITKRRGFLRIRSKDGDVRWVGGASVSFRARRTGVEKMRAEHKVGKVKINPFLNQWETYGLALIKIRKILMKIAKAQEKFSDKIDRVIREYVGVDLHNSTDELLSTFTEVCSALQMMARSHRDCGAYLESEFESKMNSLQKNDKIQIQENRKKYDKYVQKVDKALGKVEEKQLAYRELLDLSRTMSEPGWKPKAKVNFFGSKVEMEPTTVIIAKTHAELVKSEKEYKDAVDEVNKIQHMRERVIEEVKEALSKEQMHRIEASCNHLVEIIARMGKIVDSSSSREQFGNLRQKVADLNVNEQVILETSYDRLLTQFGPHEPPEDVQFYGEGWKNIFVSAEDAMIEDSGLLVPKIMYVLCKKIEELGGFSTQGIFRKICDEDERRELRKQLLRGDYEIHTDNPHLPAVLLKDWVRGIKEPFLSFNLYHKAIDLARNKQLSVSDFAKFAKLLPDFRRTCLVYLIVFFRRLAGGDNPRRTQMDIKNIGTIFAPSLLRYPNLAPEDMRANAPYAKTFIVELILKLPIE